MVDSPALAIDRIAPGLVTWPVASGSLVLGFAVADVTGVRPLGGVVLAIAASWCGLRWRRTVGPARSAALVGVYIAAFVLSHVVARGVGTWPAVLLAAATTGLASLLAADLPVARGAARR